MPHRRILHYATAGCDFDTADGKIRLSFPRQLPVRGTLYASRSTLCFYKYNYSIVMENNQVANRTKDENFRRAFCIFFTPKDGGSAGNVFLFVKFFDFSGIKGSYPKKYP